MQAAVIAQATSDPNFAVFAPNAGVQQGSLSSMVSLVPSYIQQQGLDDD